MTIAVGAAAVSGSRSSEYEKYQSAKNELSATEKRAWDDGQLTNAEKSKLTRLNESISGYEGARDAFVAAHDKDSSTAGFIGAALGATLVMAATGAGLNRMASSASGGCAEVLVGFIGGGIGMAAGSTGLGALADWREKRSLADAFDKYGEAAATDRAAFGKL